MAIARVTTQDASATGTTGLTMTYPQTPTQGNLLVCLPSEEGNGTGWTSLPSGWTQATGNGSASFTQDVWYKIAGAGESTTVTFGATGSTVTRGFIFEFSGIKGTSPYNTGITGLSNSITNTLSPSASTQSKTSQADELVIGSFLWRTDVQTLVGWNNGFTSLGSLNGAVFVGYKTIKVVDSPTMSITVTGGTAGNLMPIMATFKGTTDPRIPGNYGHYASVGDGMSRSEVAN